MIRLLTSPSLLFAGLINTHDGFCRKSGLWSLGLIKAGVLFIHMIRSSRLQSSAMLFASKLIDISILSEAFLYALVNKFLCCLGTSLKLSVVCKEKNVW